MISVWENPDKRSEVAKPYVEKNLYLPNSPWIDIFNPETRRTHWAALNDNLFRHGVDGWWMDARRNCQSMALEMAEGNDQRLHQLLTQAKWDVQHVMDKAGKHSAGVSRQYCDQRGKVDNCQIGVFGALSAGALVNLVQAKLYYPGQTVSKIDHAQAIFSLVTSV